MNDIIEFIRDYLKIEYHARVAAFSERDDNTALEAIARANSFYVGDSRAGVSRPDEVGDEERDRATKAVERPLFAVREYGGGRLYLALVGEEWRRPYGTAIGAALFVAKRRGRFKIVSRYLPCPSCGATGNVDKEACRDCKSTGWSVRGTGEAIDFGKLGVATATTRLAVPDADDSLAVYNA